MAAPGFTRVDLMAVTATLGVFALLGAPALGTSRSTSSAAVCLSNGRELMKGWSAFTIDHDGTLPGSIHGGFSQNPMPITGSPLPGTLADFQPWAQGWLDWGTSRHNTNGFYISDPSYASLASYVGPGRNLMKCPEDRFLSDAQRALNWTGRVRSISGNITIGKGNGGPGDGPWNPVYKKTTRESELQPNYFMYLEENPNSLNDGSFFPPAGTDSSSFDWVDIPGNLHRGAGMVTMVDGHVEMRGWHGAVRSMSSEPASFPSSLETDAGDAKFLFDRTPQVASP